MRPLKLNTGDLVEFDHDIAMTTNVRKKLKKKM